MENRTGASGTLYAIATRGAANRAIRRAACDLILVAFALVLVASTGNVSTLAALGFGVTWFAVCLLLGAYEVEYRVPGRDALAAGLLVATPASAVATVVARTPDPLLLMGLAPLAAVPLTVFQGDAPAIDEAHAGIQDAPMPAMTSVWTRTRIRTWDVLGAGAGLLVAGPLMVAVWMANRLWAPGPLMFPQERVGLHARPFWIQKCRTMVVGADSAGAQWSVEADPRVTSVGRWVRRSRVDELPQLWNVLRGEMSIVGPRPEQVPLVEELRRHYPIYDARHQVKPGLTGLSQVCVGYTSTVEEAGVKLSRDLYYVANQSVGLNFAISARTVRTVLAMAGR